MIKNQDIYVLKQLNKDLRKHKIKAKLDFIYYDKCPFREYKSETVEVVLKYVDLLSSFHNKIFILSSLGEKCYKECTPYLVNTYHTFLNEVYKTPRDEMDLLYLCDTIAKTNSLEYIDLYENIISNPMTPSTEPIIEMLAKFNIARIDSIIFKLIKKENLIPEEWVGYPNEDDKYWCSIIALKCIVKKKDKKYLEFFKELIDDNDMDWIKLTDSKYAKSSIKNLKKKYKLFAQRGINRIK